MNNIVGSLYDQAIFWPEGEEFPYIEQDGVRRYVRGIPLTRAEAYQGIPDLTEPGQVGAMAHWGAVFQMFEDGTWRANSITGTWSLS